MVQSPKGWLWSDLTSYLYGPQWREGACDLSPWAVMRALEPWGSQDVDSGGLCPSAPPHVPVSMTPPLGRPPTISPWTWHSRQGSPFNPEIPALHPQDRLCPQGPPWPQTLSTCFSGNHGPKILKTLELDNRSGKTGSTTVLPRQPHTLVSKLTLSLAAPA